jgi:hypothetical protein
MITGRLAIDEAVEDCTKVGLKSDFMRNGAGKRIKDDDVGDY